MMTDATESLSVLALAEDILNQVLQLDKLLVKKSISEPHLAARAATELWSLPSKDLESLRAAILSSSKQLTKLVVGPHEFLHKYVSSNWEHGALYTLLEFNVLKKIPLDGGAHVSSLASQSHLNEKKLLSLLRLISCEGILNGTSEFVFGHTAISETLVRDEKFKAWVAFQLFETRVASAHLADSMKVDASDYQMGASAFKFAWGTSMYDWHKSHPDKARRFAMAMQGVTQSLDPGDTLYYEWFASHPSPEPTTVVDVEGRSVSFLANHFPTISFRTQVDKFKPQNPEDCTDKRLIYLIRNILWNCSDADCVKLLETMASLMIKVPKSVMLVNEMMSPAPGTFERHVEKGYRRRDVTVMTMHNAKQRTEDDWRNLFARASPDFQLNLQTAATSHSYRCLWEVRLCDKGETVK